MGFFGIDPAATNECAASKPQLALEGAILFVLWRRTPFSTIKCDGSAGSGEMTIRFIAFVMCAIVLEGCARVHQEDLDAWRGVPVSELEAQPFFLTLPVVRTVTSDGTEIRRYINGRNISSCSGGGAVFKGTIDWRPTILFLSACKPLRRATISFTSRTVTFSST